MVLWNYPGTKRISLSAREWNMSIFGSWHENTQGTIFAGAFGAIALAGLVVANPPVPASFTGAQTSVSAEPSRTSSQGAVAEAVGTFIDGMAKGDEEAVWVFASEEDQAAFGTESAVYAAYADAFPQLTDVAELHVGTVRDEGDTPFVPVVLQDTGGKTWVADFGFWKNDAGDWTLISLEIEPASDNSV